MFVNNKSKRLCVIDGSEKPRHHSCVLGRMVRVMVRVVYVTMRVFILQNTNFVFYMYKVYTDIYSLTLCSSKLHLLIFFPEL